jgi:hypothetical protein
MIGMTGGTRAHQRIVFNFVRLLSAGFGWKCNDRRGDAAVCEAVQGINYA